MKGRISSLKPKGFGFITDEEGASRFFHANGLVPGTNFKDLQEGFHVVFEPYTEPGKGNGLRARRVEVSE